MLNLHRRLIGITVLLMLATSSLSATYSFAEPSNAQENTSLESQEMENCKKTGLRTILTEKIVDGKLEIQQYTIPNLVTKEEVRKTMQIENKTLNWTLICNTYNSGIVLFDGKTSKLKDNFLRDTSEIGKQIPAEGKEENNGISIIQKEIVHDYNYQIIFTANTDEFQENEFFMTLSLEFDPYFQDFENCGINEGFKSYNESIIHDYLKEKTI